MGLKPQGAAAWALTAVAFGLAVLMAALAYWMINPVRWDGPGLFGAIALFFPLHLLVATAGAALLILLATRCGARLAAWVSGAVVLLTVIMALAPVIAVWQVARQMNVPLSLSTYLAHAAHVNMGAPQRSRSIVFGKARDGTMLELDVWRTGLPDSGPLRPAILFVHGGAWTHGTRSMHPDWNRWLNGLGYEVFDVEYRLPPPARWKEEVGDVKSALGWIASHALEYHVDPARISAMGNSAGANLSLLAAYAMDDPQLPPSTDVPAVVVRSNINLYGPSDLALLYRNGKSPDFGHAAMEAYIGGTPGEFPERYKALSPLSHVSPKSPPTITLLGRSDRLIDPEQADLLDEALAKAGVRHEMVFLPGNDHGFDFNWGGFGTQVARARIKDFLEGAGR